MYEPGDEEGEGVTWERTIVSEPSHLIIDGLGADQLGKVVNCGGQLVRSTIILRTYCEQAGSVAEARKVGLYGDWVSNLMARIGRLARGLLVVTTEALGPWKRRMRLKARLNSAAIVSGQLAVRSWCRSS